MVRPWRLNPRLMPSKQARSYFSQQTSRSVAVLPVAGPSLQMRDRDDHDLVWADAIDYLVGESQDDESARPGVGRDACACMGVAFNKVEYVIDSIEQLSAKARPLCFVPAHRRFQFGGRRLAHPDRGRHLPRSSLSIRLLTRSQGSSFAVPASIAATRRSISAAHAAFASGSAGPSRLASNSAASSARDSGSSRRASASTAWAVLLMPRSYAAGSGLTRADR